MKLLVATQAVDLDDPVLGFFHGWLLELAKRCEEVSVICLREGRRELPRNVRVYALGAGGRPKRAIRLIRLAWRLRRDYDAVFVHMNPEYLLAAGPLWRLLGKRVVLWYTHRQVNFKLRVATALASVVATAVPESFGIKSKKVVAVGHGIEVERFKNPHPSDRLHTPLAIISVGRITPIKNLETLIEALAILRKRGVEARVELVGAPVVPGDAAYETRLKTLARERGVAGAATFVGAIPNAQMPARYFSADIAVNLAPTGGIDKAVLESMAAGVPTLAANRAFKSYFGMYADRLLFMLRDPRDLAEKIASLASSQDFPALRQALCAAAAGSSIERVVGRIMELFA